MADGDARTRKRLVGSLMAVRAAAAAAGLVRRRGIRVPRRRDPRCDQRGEAPDAHETDADRGGARSERSGAGLAAADSGGVHGLRRRTRAAELRGAGDDEDPGGDEEGRGEDSGRHLRNDMVAKVLPRREPGGRYALGTTRSTGRAL